MHISYREEFPLIIIVLVCNTAVILIAAYFMLRTTSKLKKIKKKYSRQSNQTAQLIETITRTERINENYLRIMRALAHDLRTPLGGITGLAGILLGEEEFSEDSRRMLELIASTGSHSLEMVNELLKSGLDHYEPIVLVQTDLKSLLFDSVELLQHQANEKQQIIIFEHLGDNLTAPINYEKIWRVFNNLIVNAIKFSYVGGEIRVSINDDKDYIEVSVKDRGIGISTHDQKAAFEMFTPIKREGTNGEKPFGIGLAISKRIVEQHEGNIRVTSSPDSGTVFYVKLPKVSIPKSLN